VKPTVREVTQNSSHLKGCLGSVDDIMGKMTPTGRLHQMILLLFVQQFGGLLFQAHELGCRAMPL